jgi:hypothetical protein
LKIYSLNTKYVDLDKLDGIRLILGTRYQWIAMEDFSHALMSEHYYIRRLRQTHDECIDIISIRGYAGVLYANVLVGNSKEVIKCKDLDDFIDKLKKEIYLDML